MSEQKSHEYSIFQQKCETLLKEDEVRFAGLINSMGKLVAGGFKEGISSSALNKRDQKDGQDAASITQRGTDERTQGPSASLAFS